MTEQAEAAPTGLAEQADATSADDAAAELARLIDQARTGDVEALCSLPHARLAAAASLRSTPRVDWPPDFADPFPDVSGRLPEVGPGDLDGATVGGAIAHHGAVLVRGLLSAADVARIGDGMTRAFEARRRAEAGEAADDGAFTPFRPSARTAGQRGKPHALRLVDAPSVLEDVLATYRRLGVLDAVAAILGEPPVLTANKAVLRFVERTDPMPLDFHQDGRFMGDDVRPVNVWVTIDDCGIDAPGLDLVPRREPQIWPTGQGVDGFDWTLSPAQVAELAGPVGVVRPELHAGDALLFDHHLVHRSAHAATMTQVRRAIECWFFAPSHAPGAYQSLLA